MKITYNKYMLKVELGALMVLGIIAGILMAIYSCNFTTRVIDNQKPPLERHHVKMIFQMDSIKVYHFFDEEHWHYFAVSPNHGIQTIE